MQFVYGFVLFPLNAQVRAADPCCYVYPWPSSSASVSFLPLPFLLPPLNAQVPAFILHLGDVRSKAVSRRAAQFLSLMDPEPIFKREMLDFNKAATSPVVNLPRDEASGKVQAITKEQASAPSWGRI